MILIWDDGDPGEWPLLCHGEKGADGLGESAVEVAVSEVQWERCVFGEGLWEDFPSRFVNEESHCTCRDRKAAL